MDTADSVSSFFFFFAAFASFLKHMGREKKVKSRQWLGEGK